MLDLKERYGKKYKITMDESWDFEKPESDKFWYYEIWGKRGWCYNQNPTTLALEVKRSLYPKLERKPPFPFVLKRGGSDTIKVLVDEKYADSCINFIRPRRVRYQTPEQKAASIARLAKFSFQAALKNVPQRKDMSNG